LVEEAKQHGQAEGAAFFFPDAASAGERLRQLVQPGDAILFKGSRGTHVEQAMEKLLAQST